MVKAVLGKVEIIKGFRTKLPKMTIGRQFSDNFWTFRGSVGPKFRTLFEKVDPIWQLRAIRPVENDRILIPVGYEV